jgi:2-keto-4-pentenoate hydratase/2-oxohepta-3-ene-1,7-dioic acid hydratase in catechol pathway
MRLFSFKTDADTEWRAGIQTAGGIADLRAALELTGHRPDWQTPRTVLELLACTPPAALQGLDSEVQHHAGELHEGVSVFALDSIHLGPPVPNPEKIICLGLNYRDHAEEAGLSAPQTPMFFAKFANSLIGPTDAIVVPPAAAAEVDYEAELAVVIGREAARLSTSEAMSCLAGVMVFNDVSARDRQLANALWTGGKAVDTFGPCGPALVTLDEIGDVMNLPVRTRVNGELVQDGTTADMIFSVAETIAFLSQIMTLRPGDIIATGTPAGVGNARTPKLFLHEGDIVEVEIDRVGRLHNPVTAEAPQVSEGER